MYTHINPTIFCNIKKFFYETKIVVKQVIDFSDRKSLGLRSPKIFKIEENNSFHTLNL